MHERSMGTVRLVTAAVCVIVAVLASAAPVQPAGAGSPPTSMAVVAGKKALPPRLLVIGRS